MDGSIQQLPLSATPVVEVVFEYHLRGTSEVQSSAMTLAGEDYGGPAPPIRGLSREQPISQLRVNKSNGDFRQSAVVPVSLWNKIAQVRQKLNDGMSNKSWPLVPLFAQCKHDGQKESRQRSEACFGN